MLERATIQQASVHVVLGRFLVIASDTTVDRYDGAATQASVQGQLDSLL